MKQNFKFIHTCGNTFRRGVTEPAISDHIRFDSSRAQKCNINIKHNSLYDQTSFIYDTLTLSL